VCKRHSFNNNSEVNEMNNRNRWQVWRAMVASLAGLVVLAGSAWGQQTTSSSSTKEKEKEPVVRTFGTEGGYRTQVTSHTIGKPSDEDQRQASLLMAEVFEHVERARGDLDADDTKGALKEVNKGREGINAIRQMIPKTIVQTKTTAPDGKTIYEDECEVQQSRIPLFEGILHSRTLAPIVAARRNAMEVAGYKVVEAERIVTEAVADIDTLDSHLTRAAKALEQNKTEEAAKALNMTLVRGLEFQFSKEDSELAAARDAIWLARRSLEENNVTQALVNLAEARQRLTLHRQVASQDQRQEVDQMLRDVAQLETQLRQEMQQPVNRAERARQNHTLTSWWDRLNGWFKRHL